MKRRIILFAIVVVILEALAILSFICIAKTEIATLGKQIVITFFLISMCVLLAILVRLFSIRPLIVIGVIFAIGSGMVIQMLGFYFFPGLIKDVVITSFDNLWRIGVIVMLHFFCYLIGVFTMIILRNIIGSKHCCPI